MVTFNHDPEMEEVDKAISELLSHWTNVHVDQEEVVRQVVRDLPTDEHNQQHVLVGKARKDRKMTPVESFVASLDGDWLLVNQVAERLQMSESWVRTMTKRSDIKAPRHSVNFGRVKVGLYNDEDVEELRGIIQRRTITSHEEDN